MLKYQHEYNSNTIKDTEISVKDIHCRVHSDSKTTWEVKAALIKFSTTLIVQLQASNEPHFTK